MSTYYRNRFKPADRTKIISKKLYAFKENLNLEHSNNCIAVNKEKGILYLRVGLINFYNFDNPRIDLKKLSFKNQIEVIDTRDGMYPKHVVTENTINPGFRLDVININEVDKIKERIDLAVENHTKFKTTIDELPKVPDGYTGWYEINKVPYNI